jgi:hypothetical protein
MDAQLIQAMGALPTEKKPRGNTIAIAQEARRQKLAERIPEGDFKLTPTHQKHVRAIAKEMGIELPTKSQGRVTKYFLQEMRAYLMTHLEGRPLDPVLREFLSQRDK